MLFLIYKLNKLIMSTHFFVNTKTILTFVLVALFFSCDTSDDIPSNNDVSGTYIGILTAITTTDRGNAEAVIPATTTVQNVGNQIEIHCEATNFDETLMLAIYENGNQMQVCYTGDAFEEMYGHMLGGGNMMGNNSQWMQHLNNDHEVGDEHFGGFNMQNHTFNFTFKTDNGDFYFEGLKN